MEDKLKTMIRKLKLSALTFVIFLSTTTNVAAQRLGTIQNPSSFNSLEEIINTALGFVRPIIILTLIVMLMYGGWVRLTAGDKSDQVANSSKIIVAAIIGFVIIVVAPAIVQLVSALLGVQDGIFNSITQ